MSIVEVLKEAYILVEPSIEDREHIDKIASMCLSNVKEVASKYDEVNNVMLVGSYAKDTWLKDSIDIDIFVKIKASVDDARFESIGKSIGFEALKNYNPYLRYSQHPYVEAVVEGIRVNVVPCYDVALDKWRSAADRSPYHTLYMLQRLDDVKRRDVRLLKRFMKVIGVYGAEIAVQGFSGYVCEVLILAYGSFINTLEYAARWREGEVISVDGSMQGRKGDNSAIIIIDPIDSNRNLGAAISYECVGRFILASRNFLARPSLEYFNYGNPRLESNPYASNVLVIEFSYRKRSDDIIWGQLKSSMNAIAKKLSINNFNVIRAGCYINNDKAYIALLLDSLDIPSISVKLGPSVFDASNADRFIAKNKGSLLWLDNKGRINALTYRKFSNAKDLLAYMLKEGLPYSGISKGIMEDLKQGFDIYTLDENTRSSTLNMVNELIVSDRYAFGY